MLIRVEALFDFELNVPKHRYQYRKQITQRMLYQAIVANLKEGTSTVNIRETASTSAKKLGKAKAGDTVDVYENDGTWSKVVYGSIEGYIMSQFLQKVEGGSTAAATPAAETVVDAAEETAVEAVATSSQLETLLQENNAQLATLNVLPADTKMHLNIDNSITLWYNK